MQIIDLMEPEGHDIKPALRRMAASDDRLQAAKGAMLLELVRQLEARGPAPRAIGHVMPDGELWLSSSNPHVKVSASVRVDWRDYGPLSHGLPVMHYRVSVKRPSFAISADARTQSPEEAEQVLLQAFGWAP